MLIVDDFDEDAQRRVRVSAWRNGGRLSSHPNIVSVFDAGVTTDGKPYIVMEYWGGGSMATRLRDRGPLPVENVIDIGTKISGALAAAHESGILHRDVKPANILSSDNGRVALADFGISSSMDSSRSVQTDALTIDYAPPEVLHGADPDARSDLYSLGITLYTLLMGTPPYRSTTNTPVAQQLVRILQDPVPRVNRADVPPELADLIQALMEKNPDERPADASELYTTFASIGTRFGKVPTEVKETVDLIDMTIRRERIQSSRALLDSVMRPTPEAPAKAASIPSWRRPSTRVALPIAVVAVAAAVAIPFGLGAIGGGSSHKNTAAVSVPYAFSPTQYNDGLLVSRKWILTGDGSNFTANLTAKNTTAGALTTSFVEVIPKSLAQSAARDIQFDPADPKPTVVQDDPVVKYNLTLAPGAEQNLSFTIHTAADGANVERLSHWADDWEKAVAATSVQDARSGKTIVIKSLVVSPHETTDLVVGGAVQLQLAGTNDDGSATSHDVLATAGWSSSNNGVATVSATGQVLGVSAGTTTITAQIDSARDEATVTVQKPAKAGPNVAAPQVTVPRGGTASTPGNPNTPITPTTGGGNQPVVTTVPGTPAATAGTVTSVFATINWTQPVDGGSPIIGYMVHRDGVARDGGGAWTTPQLLPATQRSWTLEQLEPNSDYTLSVWAVNKNGRGSAGNITVHTLSDPGPPTSATSVVTSSHDGHVDLAVADPTAQCAHRRVSRVTRRSRQQRT